MICLAFAIFYLYRTPLTYVRTAKVMVDESDLGKVIGKQGRIAKAIRTVVKAVANSDGKRVIVDISEVQE